MTDWTTPEGLVQLRKLAERATPGPWEAINSTVCAVRSTGSLRLAIIDTETTSDLITERAASLNNAVFIAAAREALPQLVGKIALAQEAFAAIKTGELSEDAALMAIGMVLLPQDLTPEDKAQAKQWVIELEKEQKR